jgi:hypothetical protein
MDAAEDFCQRRLAGSVVPDDRQDLRLTNVEVNVLQGADVAEAFGQAARLEIDGGRRGCCQAMSP